MGEQAAKPPLRSRVGAECSRFLLAHSADRKASPPWASWASPDALQDTRTAQNIWASATAWRGVQKPRGAGLHGVSQHIQLSPGGHWCSTRSVAAGKYGLW